jgi:crotonobetainyl-CoA:carnitine CoA-transferase CaiB-like acyl-CoA transferase
MANKEKFFPALCAVLEAPELTADPRFAGFPERLAHRAALEAALDPLFARYAAERERDEHFGDFCVRVGVIRAVTSGPDFRADEGQAA